MGPHTLFVDYKLVVVPSPKVFRKTTSGNKSGEKRTKQDNGRDMVFFLQFQYGTILYAENSRMRCIFSLVEPTSER